MFIQTEETADPQTMRFLPGVPVLDRDQRVTFSDEKLAAGAPLARKLLTVEWVKKVVLAADHVEVTKDAAVDWVHVKPGVLTAIMEHFVAGEPVMVEMPGDVAGPASEDAAEGEEDEVARTIRELIDTRIKPAVVQDGGTVAFHSYADGVVLLDVEGSARQLLGPIGNMLRHYVPEVTAVRAHADAADRPGLATPTGEAVQRIIDQQINPAVASHGGYITLIDVKEDTVFVELGGGCQGCGMASMTLKQGIERAIREEVPSITTVLDVTDHAAGTNPYYQPSKK